MARSTTKTPAISLQIDGVEHIGWKAIDVRIGLEQMAGAFDLRCADRWAIEGKPLPMLPGLSCTVQIAGQTIITGWIDEVSPSYSDGEHTIAIRGRDTTGDLVDGVAETDGRGWLGRSLRQIATALAAPHGISVSIDPEAEKDAAQAFTRVHLQPCETAFNALSRLACIRGLLLVADGLGGLHITRAGTIHANTPLVLGQNIKSADAVISHVGRFNIYRVIAQGPESDTYFGPGAQQISAFQVDPAIRKGRVTEIDAMGIANIADAQRLADWARSTRAAAGERATYRVRGWLDGSVPWRANTLVSVQDAYTRFNGTYLISSVRFTIDERGELTELTVTPPEAFALLKMREQSPTADSRYSYLAGS